MKNTSHLITAVLLLFVVLSSICPVSADTVSAEIRVDMTAASVSPGMVTTVPVILSHAEELLAFDMEIPNTLPGFVITINTTLSPLEGTYTPNSNPENQIQYLSWFTIHPITRDTVTLFYLDILPTKSGTPSGILMITPASVCTSDGTDIAGQISSYPVTLNPSATQPTASGDPVSLPLSSSQSSIGEIPQTDNSGEHTDLITTSTEPSPSVEQLADSPPSREITPKTTAETIPPASTQSTVPGYLVLSSLGVAALLRTSGRKEDRS